MAKAFQSTIENICKRRQYQLLAEIALSILCALFIRYALPYDFRIAYSISMLPIVTAVVAFYSFEKLITVIYARKVTKRELLFLFIPALYASTTLCFGAGVQQGAISLNYSSPLLYFSIIVIAFFLHAITTCVYASFKSSKIFSEPPPAAHSFKRDRLFLITTGILLLAWLPILLACYPGFLNYDAGSIYLGEWSQFESGQLNNHHSVLHTLILGSIITFGMNLTGDINNGVALYTIAQELFAALSFSYIIIWMEKRGSSRALRIAALLFFAISPLVVFFVFSSNSDTLFSLCFVLLLTMLIDFIEKEHPSKRETALFAVLTFFVAALRPNAPYILILLLAIILLYFRTKKIALAGALSCGIALFLIWNGPILRALDVEDSPLQNANAFSLPCQQIAYTFYSGALSEDELALLHSDGYEDPDSFQYNLSDYARSSIMEMNRAMLVKDWLIIGLKHPGTYLSAFILQTNSAWNPYSWIDSATEDGDETSLFESRVKDPATLDSKTPELFNAIDSMSTQLVLQKIPIVSLLVSIPFYVLLLILVTAICFAQKRQSGIFACICLLLLVLSALLAPGVITRYYLALIMAMPILAALVYSEDKTCSIQ